MYNEYPTVDKFLQSEDAKGYPLIKNMFTHNFESTTKSMMYRLGQYEHKLTSSDQIQIKNVKMKPQLYDVPYVLLHRRSDYLDFNILSDMFIQQVRMKCTVMGCSYSPDAYYAKFKRKVATAAKLKYGSLSQYSIAEYMWSEVKDAKQCGSFRPNNMIAIIQMFFPDYRENPINILDPSSGWGDRLMAAIATNSSLTSTDPNTALKKPHADMIKFFSYMPGTKKVNMISMGFENAKLPHQNYDLVFTSPPYFVQEKYSDEDTQSINKFTTEKQWTEQFLYPYLKKAYNALRSGGIMVIVINQQNNTNYVDNMIKYMRSDIGISNSTIPRMLGILPYTERKIPVQQKFNTQPMFIWTNAPLPKFDISTTRLVLEPFCRTDIDAVTKIWSNPNNIKFIANGQTKNRDQVDVMITRWIADYKTREWGEFYPIKLRNINTIIGVIGWYNTQQAPMNKTMLRIVIDEKYRKVGYYRELIVPYIARFRKAYIRLWSMVRADNAPMNRAMREHVLHERITFHGNKYNMYYFQ